MQQSVRLGILGCANIVEKQIAVALKQVRNCTLAAIASRDPQKAGEWGAWLGCEAESYESLLQRKDVDAIYIPLPVGLHKEWVVKAAQAGKHILCEKSLAESYASVKEMVAVCERHNVHLFENFMCQYHPQHGKVRELMDSGELGKVSLFRGAFGFPPLAEGNIRYSKALGGGSLNDAGTYPLFMSRTLFGAEPEKVTCRLHHESRGKKQDVDIQGHALLEFTEGRTALISFGFEQFYQNNYSLWGEKGILHVKRAYSIPAEIRPEVEVHKAGSSVSVDVPATNHFVLMFTAFCDAILQGKKPDYLPLLAQARAMEALRISAKEERMVKVREIS